MPRLYSRLVLLATVSQRAAAYEPLVVECHSDLACTITHRTVTNETYTARHGSEKCIPVTLVVTGVTLEFGPGSDPGAWRYHRQCCETCQADAIRDVSPSVGSAPIATWSDFATQCSLRWPAESATWTMVGSNYTALPFYLTLRGSPMFVIWIVGSDVYPPAPAPPLVPPPVQAGTFNLVCAAASHLKETSCRVLAAPITEFGLLRLSPSSEVDDLAGKPVSVNCRGNRSIGSLSSDTSGLTDDHFAAVSPATAPDGSRIYRDSMQGCVATMVSAFTCHADACPAGQGSLGFLGVFNWSSPSSNCRCEADRQRPDPPVEAAQTAAAPPARSSFHATGLCSKSTAATNVSGVTYYLHGTDYIMDNCCGTASQNGPCAIRSLSPAERARTQGVVSGVERRALCAARWRPALARASVFEFFFKASQWENQNVVGDGLSGSSSSSGSGSGLADELSPCTLPAAAEVEIGQYFEVQRFLRCPRSQYACTGLPGDAPPALAYARKLVPEANRSRCAETASWHSKFAAPSSFGRCVLVDEAGGGLSEAECTEAGGSTEAGGFTEDLSTTDVFGTATVSDVLALAEQCDDAAGSEWSPEFQVSVSAAQVGKKVIVHDWLVVQATTQGDYYFSEKAAVKLDARAMQNECCIFSDPLDWATERAFNWTGPSGLQVFTPVVPPPQNAYNHLRWRGDTQYDSYLPLGGLLQVSNSFAVPAWSLKSPFQLYPVVPPADLPDVLLGQVTKSSRINVDLKFVIVAATAGGLAWRYRSLRKLKSWSLCGRSIRTRARWLAWSSLLLFGIYVALYGGRGSYVIDLVLSLLGLLAARAAYWNCAKLTQTPRASCVSVCSICFKQSQATPSAPPKPSEPAPQDDGRTPQAPQRPISRKQDRGGGDGRRLSTAVRIAATGVQGNRPPAPGRRGHVLRVPLL